MIATVTPAPTGRVEPSAALLCVDEYLEPWRALCSTEVGVIKELYELKVDPGETPLFIYGAKCGPNLGFPGALLPKSEGSGASLYRAAAMEAAVGEAVERYCPLFVDPRDVVVATAS